MQRGLELEKLKKDNASQRELEKSEIKFKKAQDDYKALVDKYTAIRNDFETKMTQACRVSVKNLFLRPKIVGQSGYCQIFQFKMKISMSPPFKGLKTVLNF